ncbi:DNA starvation/stationary phase protection protein Dps [Flagellimonas nanhaiensis]|uniref:DNA starvation/stationary phase protection protein Dps n=2 Tax=Flagellimonas nanhaiensis TaxID=2292706 RepID=A0A371JMZ8_9FLAO|nr:DNA starvation/stationary phase protection protein Dps [Allomuricauda nanhaiensis]
MIRYKSSIKVGNKEELISILNQQLADTFDLYSQLKQAHWNVKGMEFHSLHLLFDQLAEQTLSFVDMIAERTTALGGVARGTIRMASKLTRLEQSPDSFDNSEYTITKMVERYAQVCTSTRGCIDSCESHGDKATADLFTEISRGLDKSLWMLEAHLL